MNSTIKPKKKKCACCGKEGYIFSKGMLKECWAREYSKPIKRVSDKRKAGWFDADKIEKERGITITDVSKGGAELQRWFEDRRKEMKGYCKHCGGRTQKNADNYKCSIAHILPKSHFKSVATHPLNWVELCFYGESCHTNFDNHMIDIIELNCFDEVIEKFIAMYPSIAENEKRRIPAILLQYVKDNT